MGKRLLETTPASIRRGRPRASRVATVALPLVLAACGGAFGGGTRGPSAISGSSGNTPLVPIEVRALAERPRLTVVNREGDPAPAVAVAVATDLGPVATAALSALVEARVAASGFATRVHVDRSGFRLEWSSADKDRLERFFSAIARAMHDSVVASAPEMSLVARRLVALRRAPLDAPELSPIAACTGQPGVSPAEPVPDPASPSFASELERQRRDALHAGRTSVASVGPPSFGDAVASALERSEGWPVGAPPSDPFPSSDVVSSYVAPKSSGRAARVTVAVRLGDALSAVGVAERLASPRSALRARLAALTDAFRVVEVVGVARPRGGCVSVTLTPESALPEGKLDVAAARAAAIARHEVRLEDALPPNPAVAMRQILTAADPRDAASRAAWWDLSTPVAGAEPRSAIVLGVPPSASVRPSDPSPSRAFAAELSRALAATAEPVVERKSSIERGQGELWALLASPCGVADEGVLDAGSTALALLSAVASHDPSSGVFLEPWVGAEGVGIVAHASPRDERETPLELARRVGDAAARALAAPDLSSSSLAEARASLLSHLERTQGRAGVVFGALAAALSPEHPSWLDPFGVFPRVSGVGVDASRLRLRSLVEGPLRLSVLANVDADQATEVGRVVDRWLVPRTSTRPCSAAALGQAKADPVGVRLPRDAGLGQALVAAPVPAVGTVGHELSLFTALALGGDGGLLEGTFPVGGGVRASARVVGTSRAAVLVVDVRAPADVLSAAVGDVRALLHRLATAGLSQAELSRASRILAERDLEARSEPRRRLIQLWSGRNAPLRETPAAPALSTFLTTTFQDPSITVIEGLPEN